MRKDIACQLSTKTVLSTLLLCLFGASILWATDTTLFDRGSDLLLEQRYSEALTSLENFLNENPEHRLIPAAMWTMANIHLVINKNYEQAAKLFQKIVLENPDTDWEYFGYDRLGNCFEEQENWEKAVKVYQTATKKMAASDVDTETQGRINGFRRRTLACYQQMNDYDSIITMYQGILAKNPAAPSAAEDQFQLAQAYLAVDNSKDAAKNFSQIVEQYPASNYAQQVQSEQADLLASELNYDWTLFSTFRSGMELSQTGQHEEALSNFDEVIQTKPNTPMATGAAIQKHLID